MAGAKNLQKAKSKASKGSKSETPAWTPGTYGSFAVTRFEADGHLPAAALLHHMKWRLRGTNGHRGRVIQEFTGTDGKFHQVCEFDAGPPHKVMSRKSHQWIAASRSIWAREAGLTPSEYDRAIRWLRSQMLIVAENWKLPNGKVGVWVRVVWSELPPQWPEDVSLYEWKRERGFRVLGGKLKTYPVAKLGLKKAMEANAAKFTAELAALNKAHTPSSSHGHQSSEIGPEVKNTLI